MNCVTRGGLDIFKSVNKVKGLIEPIDPLHTKKKLRKLKNVKHNLTDITMWGLKHCTV